MDERKVPKEERKEGKEEGRKEAKVKSIDHRVEP